jgi:hypothetical protein
VDKVSELKVALVQIKQLSKIPKKITMDHTLKEEKKQVTPRPPASGRDPPAGGSKLPGQVSFAGKSVDDVDDVDDVEMAGNDVSVHQFLLNKDSKWVKFTRGDKSFYQNTGIKGLNSLKMPREGIRGERVLNEDEGTVESFQKNYDKAKRMDEMKAASQLEQGSWGSLMKKSKESSGRSAESTD